MTPPKTLNGFPVIASAMRSGYSDLMEVIVFRPENPIPYVVASWNANCKNEWWNGHYFEDFAMAVGLFFDMTGQQPWGEAA